MSKLSVFFKAARNTASKHSPEILTGIGIAGMITTTVLAVKATPKALKLMEDARYDKEEDLTVPEKVKVTWKCYIPATLLGVASVGCLIGANSVNLRRKAALATAYKLSETALAEYKEKVIETVGEEKAKDIRSAIAKDKMEKNPVTKSEVIITDKGESLFCDSISGRYFKSDMNTIEKAVNTINRRLLNEMSVSLTEFYSEIGLSPTSLSEELGWNMNEGQIEIDFSSQITDDGRPCIYIEYEIAPRYDYHKFVY
jgi:hypothetical protein|nr:MAG TPA: hypothetical protein [Caudoviricetes sp.]